jgi:protein-S-isoprenylcysteine O-methyltransferase Ste14
MTVLIFGAAFAALAALNILLALTAFTGTLKLWPTPGKHSWQSYTFWPLFRGGLGLTILLGSWQFMSAPAHGWDAAIGSLLALAGFGLTVYGYFDLGIGNTYGAGEKLVMTGLYRYSRNPQYVASIIALAGLALAVGTAETAVLCAMAVAVYVLLPFAEEPWLAKAYGASYEAYKRDTPRFVSLSRLLDRALTAER